MPIDIFYLAKGLLVFAVAGLAVFAASRLSGGRIMPLDLVLGGGLVLVLLVYLLIALFEPERF